MRSEPSKAPSVRARWRAGQHQPLNRQSERYAREGVELSLDHGARLPDPDRLFNAGLDGNQRRAVDFFESERGPLLGEFTPAPGPPEVFAPEIDEMLGRLWEDAEARLFGEEVRSGFWDHLRVPHD